MDEETFKVVISSALPLGNSEGIGRINDSISDGSNVVSIVDSVVVDEGEDAVFVISLVSPRSDDTVVTVSIEDVTATSGSDYEIPSSLEVVIPSGSSSVDFTVPTLTDELDELDEEFKLSIASNEPITIENPVGIGLINATGVVRSYNETHKVLKGERTVIDTMKENTINGQPIVIGGNVEITDVVKPDFISFNSNTGQVTISPEVESGLYDLEYTLCSTEDSNICSSAIIVIDVFDVNLSVEKTAEIIDVDKDGYITVQDQIKYTFRVINNGDVPVYQITIKDPLVEVQGGPIDLVDGAIDQDTFTAIYNVTYEDMKAQSISNQAIASGQAEDPREGYEGRTIYVEDLSHDPTIDESLLVIPSDDIDPEGYTVTPVTGAFEVPLVVYNGITPNGDGKNETFHIRFLELYSDNTLQIFNRWGAKVFERDSYGQDPNTEFSGYSDGDITVTKGEKLPEGTYYYVLDYLNPKTDQRETKTGYLYLTR